jgi:single-strand DNA-binding protein
MTSMATARLPDAVCTDSNVVELVGRVAAEPQLRALPSGDELVTFRLVVARPGGRPRPRSPSVDTIDCVAWSATARAVAAALRPGDQARVEGALRRRFWRATAGPASRYDVEAGRVRRVRRAQPGPPETARARSGRALTKVQGPQQQAGGRLGGEQR